MENQPKGKVLRLAEYSIDTKVKELLVFRDNFNVEICIFLEYGYQTIVFVFGNWPHQRVPAVHCTCHFKFLDS